MDCFSSWSNEDALERHDLGNCEKKIFAAGFVRIQTSIFRSQIRQNSDNPPTDIRTVASPATEITKSIFLKFAGYARQISDKILLSVVADRFQFPLTHKENHHGFRFDSR